jgi:NTP pyrophosphatase (non-canonical NTP hydrolase)
LTEEESGKLDPKTLQMVKDEIGDVMIFLVYLADILGLDALDAAEGKLEKAAKRYPVELCQGKKDKL